MSRYVHALARIVEAAPASASFGRRRYNILLTAKGRAIAAKVIGGLRLADTIAAA
jgi:hypothetical protein